MAITKDDTTFIKGLAISFMLWHHLFLRTDDYGVLAQNLSVFMKICVAFFLFVSGYGLTKQYSKISDKGFRATLSFVLTRYAKFFLAYWFCMILVMAVGNLCGYTIYDAYPEGRNIFKCLLFDVMGIFGYDSYLSTWWFNKLIIQLYLVFPILYQLVRNKWVAVAALLAILVIEQSSCVNVFCVVEGGVLTFFLGMLLAKWNFSMSNRWVELAVSLALIIALTIVRFRMPVIRYTIVDGFIVIAVVNVLMFVKEFYSFPILHFIGQYATIMYLTHTLIQILLGQWLFALKYAVVVYLSFMAISLLVAMFVSQLQKWCKYDLLQKWAVGKIRHVIEK